MLVCRGSSHDVHSLQLALFDDYLRMTVMVVRMPPWQCGFLMIVCGVTAWLHAAHAA